MSLAEKILKLAEQIAVKKHHAPADYDEQKIKTLDEIEATIPCGSVLMLSGTAAESRLIEEVDGTDFSHAALIVRFHKHKNLHLWTADTVNILPDQIEKVEDKNHPGTHLLDLKSYLASLDKIYPSPDGSKYRFAIARLKGVAVDEKKLWETMYTYDGTPFPPTSEEFLHFIEGQANIDSGMHNSFCAQMVARTYQEMGWLTQNHPANYFNPGIFSKTNTINKLMLGNARLDVPEYFKLPV